MTLRTQMATDLADVFDTDTFAETVTYAGSSVTGIVDYGEDQELDTDATATRATLYVRASEVADPTYRDEVVIGSDTWYVLRVVQGDADVWELELMRDERPVIR